MRWRRAGSLLRMVRGLALEAACAGPARRVRVCRVDRRGRAGGICATCVGRVRWCEAGELGVLLGRVLALGPAIRVEAVVVRLALLLAGSCRLGRARVRGLGRGRGSPRGEGVVCVVVEGREVRWSLAWPWWTLSSLLLLLLLKHHVMVPLRELGRVRVVESLRRHRWIAALPRIEAWRAGRPALGRRGRGGRAGRGRRRRLLVDGVRVRRVRGRLLAGRPGRRRAGLHRRRRRNRHGHRTV